MTEAPAVSGAGGGEVQTRRRWERGGRDRRTTLGWLGAYLLACLIVGAVAGTAWFWVVDLPGFSLDNSFYAEMDERGHALVFAADMWLSAIGLAAGAGLGVLAWLWFKRLGWPCAVIAAAAGLLAALVCAWVGHLLGPNDFDRRLAEAQPGGLIEVELVSHTSVHLAVWAGAAVLPVLIAAVRSVAGQRSGQRSQDWHSLAAGESAPPLPSTPPTPSAGRR
ncbi:MAG: hypothetical protein LBK42_08920 [Propionibacteriaceae bacterium]|jgi:hypothetical protein|nr:hypothetical protein [Propionibacteriaceae bacterium]